MSTAFAIRTPDGKLKPIAQRMNGGEMLFTNDIAEFMLEESLPVEAVDNSPQGIFTIGDIRECIRKRSEAEEYEERSWIKDPTKIERRKRDSISVPMNDAWHKEHDFVEVTEWSNGEGWDITISDQKQISLHHIEFAVIKELIALLEKD
jgi:hypothetical protein